MTDKEKEVLYEILNEVNSMQPIEGRTRVQSLIKQLLRPWEGRDLTSQGHDLIDKEQYTHPKGCRCHYCGGAG